MGSVWGAHAVHLGNIPLTPHSLKSNFIFTLPERFILRRSRGLCSPLCTLMKIIHKFRPQCMAVINWASLMNIFRLFSSHQVGIRRYQHIRPPPYAHMNLAENFIFYFLNLSMKTHTCGILKWMASSPSWERLVLSLLSMIFNHVIVVLNFNLFS